MKDEFLDILLQDETRGNNMLWATDSNGYIGNAFSPLAPITPDLIKGAYVKNLKKIAKWKKNLSITNLF